MDAQRMTRRGRTCFALAALIAAASIASFAWPPISRLVGPRAARADVIYVYDDVGRLRGVVDSSGDSATYRYDAVGNLTAIVRRSAGGPAITSVAPTTGGFAATVTISGTGFGAAPDDNLVTFNGVPASVSSSTATRVVARVPEGATTGPVTLTTSGGTARSRTAFTVAAPDLVPTAFTAPGRGGTGLSISVSWTVANQGAGPTTGAWNDVVYLSTDPVCCVNDAVLGRMAINVPVLPGRTYVRTQSLPIPNVPPGQYYLILRVDAERRLAEADDANNQRVIPLTITAPDLAIAAFNAPASATTSHSFTVSWTVANLGASAATPPWVDAVYLADQPRCCATATQLALTQRTLPLSAGATYAQTTVITPPDLPPGRYYLILVVDRADNVWEDAGEANNRRVVPLELVAPDLVATALVAPEAVRTQDAFTVSWTVANQGGGVASPSWSDAIYLSADPVCCQAADILLGAAGRTTALPPGGSYTQTRAFTMPKLSPGTYFLFVDVDTGVASHDTDRANNRRMFPITVTTPDLVVTGFSAPASARVGQSVAVSWTAANEGTASAKAPWSDSVYLSTQPTCCAGASLLATTSHTAALAVGGSYTQSRSLVIPRKPAGSYYLIVDLDAANALNESDEANNQRAVPFTITP